MMKLISLSDLPIWQGWETKRGTIWSAFFGGVKETIGFEDALIFFEDRIRDGLIGLDNRWIDKKLNPKRAAIRELIQFFDGDMDTTEFTTKHANEYRSHLLDLVEAGEVKGATANKKLGHIRKFWMWVLNIEI